MNLYELLDAMEQPELYVQLFHEYCKELQKEDATISQYNPTKLAKENMESQAQYPYLIAMKGEIVGFVVFMDEEEEVGDQDCHTYIGEMYILKQYRKAGIAGKVAVDYIDSLKYDTGLCYVRGGYGEHFWKKLMDENGYEYKVFREDEIRDFIHIYLFGKNGK